jgi:hypothetical protein
MVGRVVAQAEMNTTEKNAAAIRNFFIHPPFHPAEEKGALFFYERFAQPVKVGLVVFFAEEVGFAVMPALHDLLRNLNQMDAWGRGMGPLIAKLM